MLIRQIFISPGHNYFGHTGREPDQHPLIETEQVECIAGRGLRGDRFFDYKDDYQGQITFFSAEVWAELCRAFPQVHKSPGVLRRNVIVTGVELNELIGQEFTVQGVRFAGTAHCRPCFWMDTAFGPGAEAALSGRGGLRARILCDGWLAVNAAQADAA